MKLLVLGGVLLLAGAGTAGGLYIASGSEEEVVQQVETSTPAAAAPLIEPLLTPGPGVTLWRWMNVTVLIPDESGITFGPQPIYLDAQGTQSREGISVGKADADDSEIFSQVLIDAENGAIFSQQIVDQHRAEMELVLATIAVSPFDARTAPWPYNSEAPVNSTREAAFGISFIRPDPATGIFIDHVLSSFSSRGGATPADCQLLADAIGLRNGRSAAFFGLDVRSGSLCNDLSKVHADDLAAFERYSADVRRCGNDTPTQSWTTPAAAGGPTVIVPMKEASCSGQSGIATIRQTGDGVEVTIEISGQPSGTAQPANIRWNQPYNWCNYPTSGAVIYELNDVVGGRSLTAISGASPAFGGQVIVVYRSKSEPEAVVACGAESFAATP